MAKTLKDFLNERQLGPMVVKNPDEQKFIDKHVVAKTDDRNGNDDELFKGSKVKMADRPKHRKGYNPGEDEEVYEALKGDQHKVDANKNGKVDAHDFHLLRKKKKVAEEAEQIDELSNDTLRNYRMKAKHDVDMKGPFAKDRTKSRELANRKSYGGRMAGIEKAKVMAKEEVEQIDELSKETKASYMKKAGSQVDKLYDKSKTDSRSAYKYYGRKNTMKKIANEEVEQVDEKLDMKKASMGTVVKDFQKSDAPQFMGKSQKKRQVMAVAAKLTAERGGKPLNKEERLLAKLADISETHKRTMVSVFEKLNEDNQREFMLACDTAEGIEQMLDFSIQHRGE
jgi:hypothetical protein